MFPNVQNDNKSQLVIFYPEQVFFDWYKLFKEGRERVEDEERLGHSSTSTYQSNQGFGAQN